MAMITIPCVLTHIPYTFTGVDELKPCPFCGQTDKLVVSDKNNFTEIYEKHGSATVSLSCERCSLDLYEHDYSGSNFDTKVKILIDKWNDRKELQYES